MMEGKGKEEREGRGDGKKRQARQNLTCNASPAPPKHPDPRCLTLASIPSFITHPRPKPIHSRPESRASLGVAEQNMAGAASAA
jgi:hypothetical protein